MKKKPTRAQGRPTDYKPEYDELAYNYCLLGAIDDDLAAFFDVSKQTINAWKAKHPSFLDSIKRGKEIADGKVARSLFDRACGYSHPEEKLLNDSGKAKIVAITKHHPPDTGACFIWLKNRQPGRWRDKSEVATDSHPVKIEVVRATGTEPSGRT